MSDPIVRPGSTADQLLRRAERAEADVERLREALTEIRDADPVDMALDPNWPARIAREALSPDGS